MDFKKELRFSFLFYFTIIASLTKHVAPVQRRWINPSTNPNMELPDSEMKNCCKAADWVLERKEKNVIKKTERKNNSNEEEKCFDVGSESRVSEQQLIPAFTLLVLISQSS